MDAESTANVISEARRLRNSGNPGEAIALLTETLNSVLAGGDHYLAAYLSHDLAHAEREPEAQLRWHLAALEHADAVEPELVAGFYPSAHLNLAVTYLRLGHPAEARSHAELAEAAMPVLPDDAYGSQLRETLRCLFREVDTTSEGCRRDDLDEWCRRRSS